MSNIGAGAFKNNNGELITEDTKLPENLINIGDETIKVKGEITRAFLTQSYFLDEDFFDGNLKFYFT